MSQPEVSPLPWRVGFEQDGVTSGFTQRYRDGIPVVAPCPPFAFGVCAAMVAREVDAAFIVTAVNSHEDLLAALKAVQSIRVYDATGAMYATCPSCFAELDARGGHVVGCQLIAAITKAEGE